MFDKVAKISNLPLIYNNEDLYFDENIFDNIGYIDPNSLLNDDFKKDSSIDIYSFGSLLWEIASEKIPCSEVESILVLIEKMKNSLYIEDDDIPNFPDEYKNLY